MRRIHRTDSLCIAIDQILRAIAHNPLTTERPYPAKDIPEGKLSCHEKKQAAALMRVNHSGEVAAQALYHGQSLTARSPEIKSKMQQAALEEGDHLAWCQTRLQELADRSSYLNPFWYAGSFMLGCIAGVLGDPWSLGFLAETEKQVVTHLEKHLQIMPSQDTRSQAILTKMQSDEAHHRDEAILAGGRELPFFIKKCMTWMSQVMVKTAYYL